MDRWLRAHYASTAFGAIGFECRVRFSRVRTDVLRLGLGNATMQRAGPAPSYSQPYRASSFTWDPRGNLLIFDSWHNNIRKTVILSAIGGAPLLRQLLGETWVMIGGVCALISAILAALHSGLKCEEHQAECRH
jgi:hypothetical protein